MNIKLIKFDTIDSVNRAISSLEIKLNKMIFTTYNGFNYDESFLNYKKINKIKNEIKYLRGLRNEY